MTTPAIGRIVHYHTTRPVTLTNGAPFHAAIITRAWNDENQMCNLCIIQDCMPPRDQGSVSYAESAEDAALRGLTDWWCWPPRI